MGLLHKRQLLILELQETQSPAEVK